MKIVITAALFLVLVCGCSPMVSQPTDSKTISFSRNEDFQSAVSAESKTTVSMTATTEDPQENPLTELPIVTAEEGAKWLAASEFAADGIQPDTDVEAMKAAFGEPTAETPEHGNQIDAMFYQYDGVQFEIFIRTWDDETENNTCRAYKAIFTENLIEFPREIKIGDSFVNVLKKFPQEMDYQKSENDGRFYGDWWSKRELGCGSVRVKTGDPAFDDGVWIFVGSDDYWPMLQVHFTEELIADKIVVQFLAYPFG